MGYTINLKQVTPLHTNFMYNLKAAIPNTLTLLNLSCGALGLYFVFYENNLLYAVNLVFIAAFFDFLDGFVARLLNVQGELGKQLDSLADMVTFGLLPGAMAWGIGAQHSWTILLCLLIPAFSALRLAKFNIDTRQSTGFIGVPTPMNALLWCGIVIGTDNFLWIQEAMTNPLVFAVIVTLSSLLLVTEIPLMALKFKKFDKELKLKLAIFVLPSIALMLLFNLSALILVYLLYIISSIFLKFAIK